MRHTREKFGKNRVLGELGVGKCPKTGQNSPKCSSYSSTRSQHPTARLVYRSQYPSACTQQFWAQLVLFWARGNIKYIYRAFKKKGRQIRRYWAKSTEKTPLDHHDSLRL